MEQIKKRIELTKQAIEMISEENLKAFLKGELLGLEIALKIWEKENEGKIEN